jgi:hypothetical protein
MQFAVVLHKWNELFGGPLKGGVLVVKQVSVFRPELRPGNRVDEASCAELI